MAAMVLGVNQNSVFVILVICWREHKCRYWADCEEEMPVVCSGQIALQVNEDDSGDKDVRR